MKNYWHMLGPGLTTGASDDDPAGITTYSQAGAAFGYKFLWTAALTFPLMAVVQEMCARIGLMTGRGLAASIRLHFSRRVLHIVTIMLFAANTFNIAADLGMMAQASRLFFPGASFIVLVIIFTLASLWMQIVLSYRRYARVLKWLAMVLLVYILAAVAVEVDWGRALSATIIPRLKFDHSHWLMLTAILGTTISPYLFFWQTSQEVEDEIMAGRTSIKQRAGIAPEDVKRMRVDVWSGMFFSNLVMFFIIAVCAATLHASGMTDIASAAQAAAALKPLAGSSAYLLFTLGIIGTGLLAVPVLAGASSYAMAESLGWREGLHRKFKQAHAFYGVIIFSMILGVAINLLGFDAIKMLIYSAVLNGFIAPFILVLIVLLAANRRIMKEWVNGKLATGLGFLIILLMAVSGLLTVLSF